MPGTEISVVEREMVEAFRGSAMGMALLRDGRLMTTNAAMAGLLGLAEADLTGRTLHDLLGDGVPDGVGGAEVHHCPPGLPPRWLRVSLSGEAGACLAVVEDIGDAKALEVQLGHLDRLAELGDAVAWLSHDLGQPLNVMRLSAEATLSSQADLPSAVRRSLEMVLSQSERLREITEDLLAMAGYGLETPSLFHPLPVLRAALPTLDTWVAKGRLRLECQMEDAAAVRVFGQPLRLRRVFDVVLENAVKAILRGKREGSIVVDCRLEPVHDQVQFRFIDNGVGLPPSVLEQMERGGRPHGRGMGLGLTLAVGIVAEMGGRLTAVNTHRGAEIDIALPAYSGPAGGQMVSF